MQFAQVNAKKVTKDYDFAEVSKFARTSFLRKQN